MTVRKLIPFAILLLGSHAALADGLYVLGDISHSFDKLDKGTFDSALSGAGAGSPLTSSDRGGSNQWRLQLGYGLSENFAVEAGYIDFGKSKYSASYSGGSASGELKSGGFDLALLGILPVSEEFSLFGKLGVVAANTKSSLTATGSGSAASGKDSAREVLPLVGLGVSYKLSDNLDLRSEYDRVSGLGKSGKTGTMDSNMLSIGLAYHF